MITGTYSCSRVVDESTCRTCEDYRFPSPGTYKIHSTSLMPHIKFGKAKQTAATIKTSIFINEKKPKISNTKIQNYLTTKFIGTSPYKGGHIVKRGEKFMLRCKDGNPNSDYRVFGTRSAIREYSV